MPWWALVYLILLGASGLIAAWADWREAHAGWALGELLSTTIAVIFVAAIWDASLRSILGVAVVPLFLGFLLWEIVSAFHDLRNPDGDPGLSAAENARADRAGVVMALALLLPAAAAGAFLAWQAL